MPDLISHIASGYLLKPKYKSPQWMGVFLVGICLPDLMTRPFYIIWPQLYWFVMPNHTPIGILLGCLLLSGFFIKEQRNRVFMTLLLGSMAHLALDLIQKHAHGGYALLFPISWQTFELGIFWPEQTLWFLPVWLSATAIIVAWRHHKNKLS